MGFPSTLFPLLPLTPDEGEQPVENCGLNGSHDYPMRGNRLATKCHQGGVGRRSAFLPKADSGRYNCAAEQQHSTATNNGDEEPNKSLHGILLSFLGIQIYHPPDGIPKVEF